MNNMHEMKEIGERIRYYRKRSGMSMKELGKKIGISEAGVAKYETGKLMSIDLSMIRSIAKAIGVEPEKIFSWDESDYGNPSSDQWNNDKANIDYLKNDPKLLDQYVEISRDPQVRVLFDKVKCLAPEDIETVLSVINSITRNRQD